MDKALRSYIAKELDVNVSGVEQVFGGDINQSFILRGDNRQFFLKLNSGEKGDMFEKEFRGLGVLRNTHTITVPEPLLHGKHSGHIFLLMECITKGKAHASSWEIFAKQLSALHSTTTAAFGLDHDNYIGSLPQHNTHADSWSEFYATQRVLFLMRKAFDEKKCDNSDIKMAEKLSNKLDSLFPKERPALLHGDLWSGNFMINEKGDPVIYDPAVYYGHREMDIGMSLLFGGFDKSFYSFYNEAWPLEKNWQQRVDLTQLYPLLVHLILFGGHYYHQVRNTLKKYA